MSLTRRRAASRAAIADRPAVRRWRARFHRERRPSCRTDAQIAESGHGARLTPTQLQNDERQHAADERRHQSVIEQMIPAEPQGRRRGELGVAAADPAHVEHHESGGEHRRARRSHARAPCPRAYACRAASAAKMTTSAIDTRLGIVMVSRSVQGGEHHESRKQDERDGLDHECSPSSLRLAPTERRADANARQKLEHEG